MVSDLNSRPIQIAYYTENEKAHANKTTLVPDKKTHSYLNNKIYTIIILSIIV